MKRKCGLRNVTLFLAICASVFSACFCILLMADDYFWARYKLDTHSKEFQGWEACRQTKPTYYEANAEAVNACLESLEEAKDNFWVKLPKAQFAGLLILAGLVSASGGYLVTWAVVWPIGFGIYKFTGLFAFFLNFNTKKQAHNKKIISTHSQRSLRKPPVCTKNRVPKPPAKPVGATVQKPHPSAKFTPSNSSGQAPSRVGAGGTITKRKEKQQIYQQT